MAAVLISFPVLNVVDVLKAYDRIQVHRSTTGLTGVYTEVSAIGTRPVLESTKQQYEFIDSDGASSYYYKTRYYHSTTGAVSELSDPVQGDTDPALDIISVQELKDIFLFGVDLTDENGCPFPDALFQFYIKAAASMVERRLDLRLRAMTITDERHDFYKQDYYKYIRLQTHEFPILSVESIKLVLPTEQEVIDFDPSWFQVQNFSGQTEIIPGRGQLSVIVLGQTGAWLPLIYGWTDYIPDVFRIAYTAGFDPVPDELKEVVGKAAAIGPLHVAGDLVVGAGIAAQSLSLDGISQSVSTTQSATASGYSARINAYKAELEMQFKVLREYYKGVRFVVA